MATTSNSDESTGFSDEEKSELRAMIAEAVGSATPPKPAETPKATPAITDDQWDKMTDRQRESFVRDVVSDLLDGLARDDEAARLRAEVDALKEAKTPEPERAPSVVSKIQKFLWGEPDKS